MPFKVNETYSVARECITVVAIEEEHNCTVVRPVERSSSSRQDSLQRVLSMTITISKATTPAMIQDAVVNKHAVHIGYEAAKKAKKLALGDGQQSQAAQFAKLPNYADPEAIAIFTRVERDGIRGFIAPLFVLERTAAHLNIC